MTEKQKQNEALRQLRAELAKLRKLVGSIKDRGEPIPYEASMAIDDIGR